MSSFPRASGERTVAFHQRGQGSISALWVGFAGQFWLCSERLEFGIKQVDEGEISNVKR